MASRNETKRIIQAYERRKEKGLSRLYSFFDPANLFIVQQRDQEVLNAFKSSGITDLQEKRILDVGCGGGSELRNFIRYGARPENLYGIDLLDDRVELAKSISPNMHFSCGSAEYLPYEKDYFDIVMQFTVFTSILDKTMKRNIASEMLRVLKPNGIMLWYDYHMNNPRNPDVRGVKKKEIYELLPDCDISLKRITLAPPLTRIIAPYSWLVCYLLEELKFLNTHYLAVIRKS